MTHTPAPTKPKHGAICRVLGLSATATKATPKASHKSRGAMRMVRNGNTGVKLASATPTPARVGLGETKKGKSPREWGLCAGAFAARQTQPAGI
jgi:hypothetical protein